ncbi:MAG: hypothetical protein ACOZQL_02260 [Myxococcota bacterium]
MKPLPLRSIALQAILVAFMAWLYGGDLLRAVRAATSSVALLTVAPSLELSVIGLLVTGALGVTLGLTALRKQPSRWRARRLALVGAATLLLVDFGALANRHPPMTAVESLALTLHAFADEASAASGPESVAREPEALRALLARAPAPPLFVGGEKLAAWKLEVRERCAGPASDVGTATPGTFVYCVSADRHRAWVTVVATREAQTFGAPAVVGVEPPWVAEVAAAAPDEGERKPERPVWEGPTP